MSPRTAIGLVAATAGGRSAAEELRSAWPGEARPIEGDAADALRSAWRTCDAIVSFLAVGATVRILAPLLGDKTTDPAVVCVDEARAHAVAVLGGHHGANALAQRVGEVLGCRPVITTALDQADLPALDSFGADLGFHVENRELLASVGTRLLSGEPVRLAAGEDWPLPPLPRNVVREPGGERAATASPGTVAPGSGGRPAAASPGNVVPGPVREPVAASPGDAVPAPPDIVISDLAGETALCYRPPSLVVGVGSIRGVSAREVGALIDEALAGLSPLSVRCVATVDLKANEPGILAAARERGWPVETYPAAELARIAVPNPSEAVRAEIDTPSVAEAAALRAASAYGRSAELIVEKRKSAGATVAVARLRPRGRLAIVGLGPGARDLLTPRAVARLRRASVVVGLDQYVAQVRDLLRPGTRVIESGLGQEERRARTAVEEAARGHAVALIGSGDAGVYAMAAPALEFADQDIDVEGVPGITAAASAASLLGAPLGHDHAYISLSDLHTPWDLIERRLRGAADGDFTVCLYNPRSRKRDWQLPRALQILARPPQTPVGYVRNATRPDETVTLTTLADFDPAAIDMFTVVIVGSTRSRMVAGRFVTPRGYQWA